MAAGWSRRGDFTRREDLLQKRGGVALASNAIGSQNKSEALHGRRDWA